MDEFSDSRAGTDELVEEPAGRLEEAGQEVAPEPEMLSDSFADPDHSARGPRKGRFHPSRYQFDLRSVLLLFTFFSLVFLPMTLVPPQDRFAVGVILAISVCLAIYAFGLISWIPDSALVVFLVSAPVGLVALASLAAILIGR